MKRVILVTGDRLLIEKVTAALSAKPEVGCHLLSTSNYHRLDEDVSLFEANVLVIDAIFYQLSCVWELLEKIDRHNEVKCHILLLLSGEVVKSIKETIIKDKGSLVDYVLYDDSLSGLFEKLNAM